MFYLILIGIILYLLYKEYKYAKQINTSLSVWFALTALLIGNKENKSEKEKIIRKELLRVFAYYSNTIPATEHNSFWKTLCKNFQVPVFVDNQNNVSAKVVDELAHKLALGVDQIDGIVKHTFPDATIKQLEEYTDYNEQQRPG